MWFLGRLEEAGGWEGVGGWLRGLVEEAGGGWCCPDGEEEGRREAGDWGA